MKERAIKTDPDIDHGWAWVVLFAATSTQVITSTMIYCTGVIHFALLQKYQGNNAYTSLIGSLNSSLLSLVGVYI